MKIILILAAIALIVSGCSGDKPVETSNEIQGFIVHNFESSLIIADREQPTMLYSIDQTGFKLEKADSSEAEFADFLIGEEVSVFYSGEIMESYPMQIGDISSIKLTKKIGPCRT